MDRYTTEQKIFANALDAILTGGITSMLRTLSAAGIRPEDDLTHELGKILGSCIRDALHTGIDMGTVGLRNYRRVDADPCGEPTE